MVEMFNNYNNISTSLAPNPYSPQYPPQKLPTQIIQNTPNKPYEVIDARGVLAGYFWYYGNSIDLVWDIIGEITSETGSSYTDIVDSIKDKTILATIYDWKFQEIYKVKLIPSIVDDKVTATLSINGELSQKLVKGNYRISLTLLNELGYNETIFDTNICNFEVR